MLEEKKVTIKFLKLIVNKLIDNLSTQTLSISAVELAFVGVGYRSLMTSPGRRTQHW